ncbi:MAG TPA: hypothetical protein PLC54_06135, partial [Spirochaetales bacterium]|nr:hypothetical protein [Spirochaetales bacterium]
WAASARAELALRVRGFRLQAIAAWADKGWIAPDGKAGSGTLFSAQAAYSGNGLACILGARVKQTGSATSMSTRLNGRLSYSGTVCTLSASAAFDGTLDNPWKRLSTSCKLGSPAVRWLKLSANWHAQDGTVSRCAAAADIRIQPSASLAIDVSTGLSASRIDRCMQLSMACSFTRKHWNLECAGEWAYSLVGMQALQLRLSVMAGFALYP